MSRNITRERGNAVKKWLDTVLTVLLVGVVVGGGALFAHKKFEAAEAASVNRDKEAVTREKTAAARDEKAGKLREDAFKAAEKRFEAMQKEAVTAQAKRENDFTKMLESQQKEATAAQTKRDKEVNGLIAKLGADAEKSAAERDKAATLREQELNKQFAAQLKQASDAQTKRDEAQLKLVTKLAEDAQAVVKANEKVVEGLKTQIAALETAAGKRDAAAQKQIDALTTEISQLKTAHSTAVADAKKLGDKLVQATSPKVGLYDEPLLEVIEEYGGTHFFVLFNRGEEVPPPDSKIIEETRKLYVAVLGVKEDPFTGKVIVEGLDDKGKLPEGTKSAKYWRIAYERKDDRSLPVVIGKGTAMIQAPTPKSMFVYKTGVKVTWTRAPEHGQVERLTPHMLRVLDLAGFKPGAHSGWHDARNYVFAP